MRKFTLLAFALVTFGVLSYLAFSLFTSNAPSPPRQYIGTASIDQKGVITLRLDATAGQTLAQAVIKYSPNDPNYVQVLDHIKAGLNPGQTLQPDVEVLIKPWPSGTGTASEEQANVLARTISKSKAHTVRIDRAGKVSAQFVAKIQNTVNLMPDKIRKLLDDNGVRIVAANYVTDALPSLKGQQPRGYPPGSTWEKVDGIYHGWQTIVVAEHHLDDNNKEAPNHDPEGVTRHEIGHAVNAWLGDYAQTSTFTTAYDNDVANMPADVKETLKYFLQTGEGGKSETFAEVFASLNGGVSRPKFTTSIPKYFPETAKVVQKKLDRLR